MRDERLRIEGLARLLRWRRETMLERVEASRLAITELARSGDLSIAELSRLTGVSRQTLTRWRDS